MTYGQAIRDLSCSLLINCDVTYPETMLDEFASGMSEDLLRKRQHSAVNLSDDQLKELAHNDLLASLNSLLEQFGKSNSSFNIAMPDPNLHYNTISVDTEHDPDAETFYKRHLPLLTPEQKGILTPSKHTSTTTRVDCTIWTHQAVVERPLFPM